MTTDLPRATKKWLHDYAALEQGISALLESCGATTTRDRLSDNKTWTIQTRYGPLSLHMPILPSRGFTTVFGRFADPDRARPSGCNPYSGKWNHHWSGPIGAPERNRILTELRRELESFIARPTQTPS